MLKLIMGEFIFHFSFSSGSKRAPIRSVQGVTIESDSGKVEFGRGEFKHLQYDDISIENEIVEDRVLETEASLVILSLGFEAGARWTHTRTRHTGLPSSTSTYPTNPHQNSCRSTPFLHKKVPKALTPRALSLYNWRRLQENRCGVVRRGRYLLRCPNTGWCRCT